MFGRRQRNIVDRKRCKFPSLSERKTTGEIEMRVKECKKVPASVMLCSNHLDDAFTRNHVVFCVTFCFSSRVSVLSSVRISLARLGANWNPIICLFFSPASEFLSPCCPCDMSRCTVERINSLLYVDQNERTLLCMFNKSGPEDPIFERVLPFLWYSTSGAVL